MVYEFCPSKRLTAIVDSDEFLMMELRPELRSIESIRLGRTAPKDIAKRTSCYMTQYQADNAEFQLLLHSADLPKGLPVAQQSLKKFVGTVLKNLPANPINHRNHRQWRYHKRHFRGRAEARLRLGWTRRRKGEPPTVEGTDNPDKLLDPNGSFLKRVGEIAHPYKSPRGALKKSVRELADRNASILAVCDRGSYLLHALDYLPGIQTHLSPELAIEGLSSWPRSGPRFDLCLLEVAGSKSATLEIVDAAIACMRAGGRLLLLWHDRLDVSLRPTVTEIMKIITLRQLDFTLDYTLSRTSVLATKFLRLAAGAPGKFGLGYPLKWCGFLIGASLAVATRLKPPLGSRKPRYLTRNCSSVTVDLHVDQRLAKLLPRRPHVARSKVLLSRAPADVDLYFNTNPEFTKWVIKSGLLHEPFVVIDVGVLGGENARWHLLGEYLVVHGFDAIKEVIEELRVVNWDINWNRSYHWLAIGNDNCEKEFFVDPSQPTRSSLGADSGLQRRLVPMRSLDSLLMEGAIPQADFLKVDVEGYEAEVFAGARQMLKGGVLGIEVETNFSTSRAYPKCHFDLVHNVVLEDGFRLFDLNFDRSVRPLYESARQGRQSSVSTAGAGAPTTFNVLFCRDLVAERDGASFYERPPSPPTVDQIIKIMIVYELHGLSDVAVETAIKFSKELKTRIDVNDAIDRLCK